MNYGEYNGYQVKESYHLHLGVDNETGKDAYFKGILDEVAIYNRCLVTGEIAKLAKSGYSKKGVILSDVVTLDGAGWGEFKVDTETGKDTEIVFDILDKDAKKTLLAGVKPGDVLHGKLKALRIRLRATLKTNNPAVTPILKSWEISGTDD